MINRKDETTTLAWADVEPVARSAFNIWTGQPEVRWARGAWEKLETAGLADFSNGAERCRVLSRFLALASIYRDWCAVAFDERHDDDIIYWIGDIELEPVHLAQALGPGVEVDDVSEAFLTLLQQERSRVVKTIFKGFGGEVGLFMSLWHSPQPFDGDEDDDWSDNSEWTDDDILIDPDEKQLAAYSWVAHGCEYIGPVRCDGEIDD